MPHPAGRLKQRWPRLSSLLATAGPSQRRATLVLACCLAARRSALEQRVVASALESLESGRPASRTLRQRMQALAERLDRVYLRAANRKDPDLDEVARLFRPARAAAAIRSALEEAAEEAIYEAMFSGPDPEALAEALEAAVRPGA